MVYCFMYNNTENQQWMNKPEFQYTEAGCFLAFWGAVDHEVEIVYDTNM